MSSTIAAAEGGKHMRNDQQSKTGNLYCFFASYYGGGGYRDYRVPAVRSFVVFYCEKMTEEGFTFSDHGFSTVNVTIDPEQESLIIRESYKDNTVEYPLRYEKDHLHKLLLPIEDADEYWLYYVSDSEIDILSLMPGFRQSGDDDSGYPVCYHNIADKERYDRELEEGAVWSIFI